MKNLELKDLKSKLENATVYFYVSLSTCVGMLALIVTLFSLHGDNMSKWTELSVGLFAIIFFLSFIGLFVSGIAVYALRKHLTPYRKQGLKLKLKLTYWIKISADFLKENGGHIVILILILTYVVSLVLHILNVFSAKTFLILVALVLAVPVFYILIKICIRFRAEATRIMYLFTFLGILAGMYFIGSYLLESTPHENAWIRGILILFGLFCLIVRWIAREFPTFFRKLIKRISNRKVKRNLIKILLISRKINVAIFGFGFRRGVGLYYGGMILGIIIFLIYGILGAIGMLLHD